MSERPRIFHLIKSLGRGGAEMLLPETLRFADRDRFSYRYAYFLPWKDSMVSDLEEQGVEVDCIEASSPLQILLKARRIAELLQDWDADVLHCHLPMAGVVGRVAGRMASVPVVYTEHNLLERYHPLTRRANLLTWRWQEEVIAVSGEVAQSLGRGAAGSVPVNVVLNGVDVHRFDRSQIDANAVRERLGIPPDAPVVGTVAVFRSQKRLHHWLEAGRRVLDGTPDCRFLLVGDGPLRIELQERAQALGMEDVVHWPGLQEDVRPYLAAMDVYMMSSAFEGLPIALLEAMSMKCPVVCTAVGGIPEVIEDGVNGVLVEPERPTRLGEALRRVLDSTDDADRMGELARTTVEERFSLERMARELEEIYMRVIRRFGNGR